MVCGYFLLEKFVVYILFPFVEIWIGYFLVSQLNNCNVFCKILIIYPVSLHIDEMLAVDLFCFLLLC